MYGGSVGPKAVAHRGLHFRAPENSLDAFQLAVDAGAEGIELDVHATSDGHVVVHHDFEVGDDPTEVERIAELDLNKLQGFPLSDGSPIPLLSDLLNTVPSTIDLFIEVKPAGIEQLVVDCLTTSAFPLERCAIHSFDHRIARNARALSSQVAAGILQVGYPLDPIQMLKGADARDFWQHWEFIDAEIVESVHRAGCRIVAWTCNDPRGWARLSQIGVDAICTDSVDELIEWRSAIGPAH